MAENSRIEWTDHTFNPVIGCQKVSPGCDHCYAEAMAKRYGWTEWGPHGERKRTSAANWRKPHAWNRAAIASGDRVRVFCASLADVFDNQWDRQVRSDLFDLIAATPGLDWLLLTKRPQNIVRMFPTGWWGNVWLGTTCEDQERYNERWPLLAQQQNVPVRFISYEPALGPLLPRHIIAPDWIICGGESGPHGRRMEPAWARELRDWCKTIGIAFFQKQMTRKVPIPPDLMVREFPT